MYEFKSRIRFSEIGENGRLTLASLLDYFQDCSTFQSEDLGVGMEYLKERNLLWVLSAWQIVVNSYPKMCENVSVRTKPYDFKGFIGYRNFDMVDENGNRIAAANSIWALIDSTNAKPVVPNEEIMEKYVIEEKLDMDYAPRKIRLVGEGVAKDEFKVMAHHLDNNHHVNNGQYVRMAMKYLPEDFVIGQLRAEYKAQARLDDVIVPKVYEYDGKIAVSLCAEDGEVFCISEFSRMENKDA